MKRLFIILVLCFSLISSGCNKSALNTSAAHSRSIKYEAPNKSFFIELPDEFNALPVNSKNSSDILSLSNQENTLNILICRFPNSQLKLSTLEDFINLQKLEDSVMQELNSAKIGDLRDDTFKNMTDTKSYTITNTDEDGTPIKASITYAQSKASFYIILIGGSEEKHNEDISEIKSAIATSLTEK